MTRVWRPGDVAVILIAGLGERRAIYTEHGRAPWMDECGAHWNESVVGVRPLVVIDPDDRRQVERLVIAWHDALDVAGKDLTVGVQDTAMQSALAALLGPPKPEEPTGLGAVVEDARSELWIRDKTTTTVNHWKRARGEDSGSRYPYSHIAAVKVLSKGVTA